MKLDESDDKWGERRLRNRLLVDIHNYGADEGRIKVKKSEKESSGRVETAWRA